MSHQFKPESLMMGYAYKPELSQGAIKCPIFQTSTFAFQNAEEGKYFFEVAYGKREQLPGEELGLIYSRINNPDLEILENRLCLWDQADECAVFESGMSAITTVMLEFLAPGDLLVHSAPVYGGTDHFINHFLTRMGIHVLEFKPGDEIAQLRDRITKSGHSDRFRMMYIETPANPTNNLIDIEACIRMSKEISPTDRPVITAVDNTYLGPLWQHPLKLGADLVIYSATKYIGGHSDIIAGAVLGNKELMKSVKTLRTFLGNMAGPWTGWLLMRSLETLKIRMERQQSNAIKVAQFLKDHPKVESVNYLDLIPESSPEFSILEKQCKGTGAMLSFLIKGGESEVFKFLNHLKLIKLAVSLGSTESLAEHPRSMTHAGMRDEHLDDVGVTHNLVRLSVGIENEDDLIWDIKQSLDHV